MGPGYARTCRGAVSRSAPTNLVHIVNEVSACSSPELEIVLGLIAPRGFKSRIRRYRPQRPLTHRDALARHQVLDPAAGPGAIVPSLVGSSPARGSVVIQCWFSCGGVRACGGDGHLLAARLWGLPGGGSGGQGLGSPLRGVTRRLAGLVRAAGR
jgi:hypothetical protein